MLNNIDLQYNKEVLADLNKKISITQSINIIVGGYGSGKSEVAVNLARYLVQNRVDENEKITIVDLDIINPYFRSREASLELEKLGIESIVPKGAQFHADLPIILPEIKGAIQNRSGKVILDVGGDDVGARVLSSFAGTFIENDYEMMMVLNANRPFTSSVENSIETIKDIESSSRLKFTAVISNTHLMEDTSEKDILDGLKLAREVCRKLKLKLMFVSATEHVFNKINKNLIDAPLLYLNRSLLKPWEKK